MGEDPERIEREIERTRAKLGDDLDALEEKVNPKKVAHRSVDRAKEKAADLRGKVVEAAGSAREKVAGAGSARPPGGVGERVPGLAGTARERVGPLASSMKEQAAARSGLDPQTADTREVATAAAVDAWSTLLEQTRRNPLVVGTVAFVLGVVLGR